MTHFTFDFMTDFSDCLERATSVSMCLFQNAASTDIAGEFTIREFEWFGSAPQKMKAFDDIRTGYIFAV